MGNKVTQMEEHAFAEFYLCRVWYALSTSAASNFSYNSDSETDFIIYFGGNN